MTSTVAVPDRAFFELMYPHPEWMTDEDEQEKHYQDLESASAKAAKRAAKKKPKEKKKERNTRPDTEAVEKQRESNYKAMCRANRKKSIDRATGFLFHGQLEGGWPCPACRQGENGQREFLQMASFCLRSYCSSTGLTFPEWCEIIAQKNDTLDPPFEYYEPFDANDSFWRMITLVTLRQAAAALTEQIIFNQTGWAPGKQARMPEQRAYHFVHFSEALVNGCGVVFEDIFNGEILDVRRGKFSPFCPQPI